MASQMSTAAFLLPLLIRFRQIKCKDPQKSSTVLQKNGGKFIVLESFAKHTVFCLFAENRSLNGCSYVYFPNCNIKASNHKYIYIGLLVDESRP